MINTPITEMLGIEYPVFQGGMAWVADGKLAAAVSNGGGLGIIAAGNAPVDVVREEIHIAKSLTDKPFGVNIMLMSHLPMKWQRSSAKKSGCGHDWRRKSFQIYRSLEAGRHQSHSCRRFCGAGQTHAASRR